VPGTKGSIGVWQSGAPASMTYFALGSSDEQ
jgi:hypothetical protein